jgi:hypothetical protein
MVLRLALLTGLAVTVSGCPSPEACESNKDCFKGFACTSKRCVAVSDAGTSTGGGSSGGGTAGGTAGGVSGGGLAGGGTSGGTAGGAAGGAATDGETCALPRTLSFTMPINGTTVGARDDVTLPCTGFLNRGKDIVYATTVPAGERLVVTVTPTDLDAGLVFDPSLSIVAAPSASCTSSDAGVCLAGQDQPGADTAAWLNDGVLDRDVFVIVDAYLTEPDVMSGIAAEGAFTLTARLELPGAGDRCETAERLMPTGTRTSTLTGYGPDYAFSNRGSCALQSGPDRVFVLEVPPGERVTATATPTADAGLDVVVNLLAGPAASCNAVPAVCLARADRGFSGEPDSASFVNTSTMSQSVFVVIGSYFASPPDTDFTLTTQTVAPPPGDTCATATTLTPGTTLTAQSLTPYGDDLDDGQRCASAGFVGTAADRFYSVTLPAGKQLTVTVTPQPGLDTLVSFIDAAVGCGAPLTCLAGDVVAMAVTGQPDTLVYTNRTGALLTVLVDVDSRSGTSGTFDIIARIVDPPAGDSCDIAATLTLGTPATGSTIGATNDYEGGDRCASGVTGPDLTYALGIPPGLRVTVTVTPTSGDGGFNPSISLIPGPASSCEATPPVCVGAANALPSSSAPRSATAFNGSTAALPLFAIIDGLSGGAGTFSLSATAVAPIANDVCSTTTAMLPVMPLASLQPLTGQTLAGFSRDYDCVSTASGFDRLWLAPIGAQQRLTVTVTPTPVTPDAGSFDPVISVIDGPASTCDSTARQCLGAIDDNAQAGIETLRVNNAGAARSVYVAVGAWEPSPLDSTFSIVATSEPITIGDVCEKPFVISTSNTLTGQSLVDMTKDYALSRMGCQSFSGADSVFQLTFTSSVTVTVTPDASSDVVLNLVDGPASSCATAPACLASADIGGNGGVETLSFVNTSGARRTAFLVVSRYSVGPMTFTVAATLN